MAPELGVPLFLLLLLLLLLQLSWPEAAPSPAQIAKPGCQDRCGDVMIPYPFGIGPSCSRDANFAIDCNTTFTPPKAYLSSNNSNVQIINISLSEGQVRIYTPIGWVCYDRSGSETSNFTGRIDLKRSNYKFSYTRNVFMAIGCYSLALIRGRGNQPYTTGCASLCQSVDSTTQGLCSGVGCCETPIPKGLNYYHVQLFSFINSSDVFYSNWCRFAFVAERGWYSFNQSDLRGIDFYNKNKDGVPMVLDWVAGRETCEQAAGLDRSSYACRSDNSKCYDLPDVGGYRCNCSGGYEGKPYLTDGCRDINECERPDQYLCNGKCENFPGTYPCYCPKGTQLDLTTRNCKKKPFPALAVALGLSVGLFLLFILGSWIYWGLQKRKVLISRQRFFEQNGGLLLKRQISSHHGATFKIYNIQEIEEATNKFDRQMFLGEGGQGTVYKGNLDNRQVAIKKCKIANETQSNEFATEMLIISQINHKNVVKLLGCCLEVDVPILVY